MSVTLFLSQEPARVLVLVVVVVVGQKAGSFSRRSLMVERLFQVIGNVNRVLPEKPCCIGSASQERGNWQDPVLDLS